MLILFQNLIAVLSFVFSSKSGFDDLKAPLHLQTTELF